MNKQIEFTHYWISGFGWENTIFQPEDFTKVEKMGYNDTDGYIFLGISDKESKHILKGKYNISL
jgi:hypothetical protein